MNRKKAEAQCGKQSKMAKVTNATDGVKVKLRLRFRTFWVRWAPSPQLNAEPWRRRSAWARSSQHWSAWLNSSSRSWSQWQVPLIKIPAVPAGQTARERRLNATLSSFPGAPGLGVLQQNGVFLVFSTSNPSLYKPVLSRTLCFWRAKKSKKDGAANIAKKN